MLHKTKSYIMLLK